MRFLFLHRRILERGQEYKLKEDKKRKVIKRTVQRRNFL